MAGVKPSAISSATVAAFKTKLGYLTQSEADLRYPQISEGEPVDLDALLALKADLASPTFTGTPLVPTAAAGTSTTQVANTAFVNNAVSKNNILSELQLLGVNISAIPYFSYALSSSSTHTMVDGTAYVEVIRCLETKSYSGVGFIMNSPTGNYTADNFNGFVLYSISGGIMTEIARTADTPNLWKATAFSITNTAFVTPVTLTAENNYAIVGVWNASATTTAPVIQTFGAQTASTPWITNIKLHGSLATQNTLPSSYNFSSFTTDAPIKSFFLY